MFFVFFETGRPLGTLLFLKKRSIEKMNGTHGVENIFLFKIVEKSFVHCRHDDPLFLEANTDHSASVHIANGALQRQDNVLKCNR